MRFIIFIGIFCILSCQKEVSFDQLEYEPYIIANSIVSTDSIWSVQLYHSQTSFNDFDLKPIENATIQISVLEEENGTSENIQNFFLNHVGNGLYTRGNKPTEGKTYLMEVSADGMEAIAQTFVPKSLEPSVIRKKISIVQQEGEEGERIEIDLAVNEDEGRQNYYAWDIINIPRPTQKDSLNEGETDDEDLEGDDNIDDVADNIDDNALNILLRNPSNLISSSGDGSISFAKDVKEISSDRSFIYPEIPDSNPDTKLYKITVLAISYDYYKYLSSIQNPKDLGSSEVRLANPYSNIKNGGGIFAGYNLKELFIELE